MVVMVLHRPVVTGFLMHVRVMCSADYSAVLPKKKKEKRMNLCVC